MATKISTRHLQMVMAVAKAGSVSEAASEIGLTQSALSHRIREAERLLNTELFYRQHKKLIPTSAGQRLLLSASVVLSELERAENDIDKLSVGIEHVIRVGNEVFGGYHWLPPFIQQFSEAYPSYAVEIIPDVSLDPFTALRNGTIDLAIVSGTVTQTGFRAFKLFRDEMVAVLPSEHPDVGKAWLTPQDIAANTYITYHTTPAPGREYEQLFSPNHLLPPKVIRAGVTEAVVEFVRTGTGITIMPSWIVKPYLKGGGLKTVKVTQQGLYIHWQALVRKDERSDSPIVTFAKALKKTDLQAL
ncbi:LysR family transcriptional regulator [Photobacterium galatheae]|uniref:LysR family transcriptional regulator n=1 Tax=Photobacterium galatheae TaxID=1654360 RepID=A0A066RSH6_9GAMM|nr:LysR family transcriptional regulator [Photobacterium galatheae]KDM93410.1 LysR family transcriptional regulator [Photobacterium galatheae]MCM0146990.1 LysR family transcriptional regulator [Photobacterium galatheae]